MLFHLVFFFNRYHLACFRYDYAIFYHIALNIMLTFKLCVFDVTISFFSVDNLTSNTIALFSFFPAIQYLSLIHI